LISVLANDFNDSANIDRVKCLDDDCQIAGPTVELTHVNLLFSGFAGFGGGRNLEQINLTA
jgi:hypothetical protein